MTSWFSTLDSDATDRLVAAWSDAPIENQEVCAMLLDIAREQVIEYAEEGGAAEQVSNLLASLDVTDETIAAVLVLLAFPEDPDSGGYSDGGYGDPVSPIPSRYAYAQLQQAINLWNAGRSSGDGNVGADGTQYTFTPRPLDKTIRTLIRPTSGTPDVF